jgi:steroid delta-isomerase-like uncharacterized protein
MATQSTAREIATKLYVEMFDTGDVSAVDRFYAADFIDHNPAPGAPSAIESMRGLVSAIRDGFTDTKHTVVYQAETDDGCIVTQWVMTGKHTGPWFGTPATGRDVSFAGTDIVRVTDGRVVELWHVEELLQLQAQISG